MKKIQLTAPYLFLPKLQKSAVPNRDKIFQSHSGLFIEAEPSFWKVWEHGPSDQSLPELSRCMVILGKAFCQLVKAGQGNVKVMQKTSPLDLVTEVDKGIEMLLRLWIKQFYPHHKIIGEEGFKESFHGQDWVWYIDPVDGTSNFVDGNEKVAMHVGCIGQGKPLFSMVGLPIQDRMYFTHAQDTHVYDWRYEREPTPKLMTSPLWENLVSIGTEYMEIRKTDAALSRRLTKKLGLPHYRVKSIGINLIDMIDEKVSMFYRNRIKLWDIMAPMGILYHLSKGALTFELGIPDHGATLTRHNVNWVSPFSCDEKVAHWFTNRHKRNSRVGLILVYPTAHPELRPILIKAILGAD